MPSIKLPTDYFRQKEVQRFIELSGDWFAGLYVRVLCLAAEQKPPDGRLYAHSPRALEAFLGWKGRLGRAEHALVESGILTLEKDCYRVVNWVSLQPEVVKYAKLALNGSRGRWKNTVNKNAVEPSTAMP